MHPRAEALIRELGLLPHPEGGHYRELYRSPLQVHPPDGRGDRAALTTIYFLLPAAEISRWHRVSSDEVWHHLEGAPLELVVSDPDLHRVQRHLLGPLRDGLRPEVVVPPGHWQAARSTGDHTLVGCVVAPGFDFADFTMLRDLPDAAERLRQRQPDAVDLL
ncbi:MAG TPA: cupin domain-containing protein [Flavobacteriales bacterium]|nr:cupin domain-containing protein [Flavobacteriales bacterium]HMR27415.1 cupin domain-containing protein [Flavobacteriales bacterium]